jgi:hypothetical protein
MILVGTRLDERGSREVSVEKAKLFADKMKIRHFEVSAKTGENVQTALEAIVALSALARQAASRVDSDSSSSEESLTGTTLHLKRLPIN